MCVCVCGTCMGRQLYAFCFILAAWLSHIAANIVSKLVASAITKNADPRKDDEEDIQDSFVLSRQDLAKVWFFLAREVLCDVLMCASCNLLYAVYALLQHS